ncbi:MAG: hypothetical protein IJS83_03055, partial [Acholeplasmatales bacterium]|nr:hypothetical protein [Acholeplasmatales bacterium]
LSAIYASQGDSPAADVTTAYNDGLAAIDAATNKDAVDTAYATAESILNAADLTLDEYKQVLKSNLLGYRDEYKALIPSTDTATSESIVHTWLDGVEAIDDATTKAAAYAAYQNCVASMYDLTH